jgi:hypothetical protein
MLHSFNCYNIDEVKGVNMSDKVEMDMIPKCDFCRTRNAKYDAKTIHGSWAYMCPADWRAYRASPRLGTGHGQELVERKD